jgi:hypothetical protein
VAENLRLKSVNFESDQRVSTLQFMVEQAQKRMRMLNERTQKVLRELGDGSGQGGGGGQNDGEWKRQVGELDVARRELEKMRRDKEHRLEDLRRIEAENMATKKEQPDLKIEELERQLRQAEAARKDA